MKRKSALVKAVKAGRAKMKKRMAKMPRLRLEQPKAEELKTAPPLLRKAKFVVGDLVCGTTKSTPGRMVGIVHEVHEDRRVVVRVALRQDPGSRVWSVVDSEDYTDAGDLRSVEKLFAKEDGEVPKMVEVQIPVGPGEPSRTGLVEASEAKAPLVVSAPRVQKKKRNKKKK